MAVSTAATIIDEKRWDRAHRIAVWARRWGHTPADLAHWSDREWALAAAKCYLASPPSPTTRAYAIRRLVQLSGTPKA